MEIERSTPQTVQHYYRLSLPVGEPRPLPVLLALHGYAGDMVSMMRLARSIAGDRLMVASLQGPHQFLPTTDGANPGRKVGFGWLTPFKDEESRLRHHQFIRDVIEDLRQNYEADPGRIFLMGFSQACALNYRYAFTHPGSLRGVIGVCGGLPGDFDRNPHYRSISAGILHIAATQDEYYGLERTRAYETALRSLVSDVVYKEYEGPHAFPRRSLPLIRRWILERC